MSQGKRALVGLDRQRGLTTALDFFFTATNSMFFPALHISRGGNNVTLGIAGQVIGRTFDGFGEHMITSERGQ